MGWGQGSDWSLDWGGCGWLQQGWRGDYGWPWGLVMSQAPNDPKTLGLGPWGTEHRGHTQTSAGSARPSVLRALPYLDHAALTHRLGPPGLCGTPSAGSQGRRGTGSQRLGGPQMAHTGAAPGVEAGEAWGSEEPPPIEGALLGDLGRHRHLSWGWQSRSMGVMGVVGCRRAQVHEGHSGVSGSPAEGGPPQWRQPPARQSRGFWGSLPLLAGQNPPISQTLIPPRTGPSSGVGLVGRGRVSGTAGRLRAAEAVFVTK